MKKNHVWYILLVIMVIGSLFLPGNRFSENKQLSPEKINEFMKKAAGYYAEGDYEGAITFYTKAADCGNAWGQNNLAWILATVEVVEFRDGELAVQYARKAVEQEPENAAFVRTLAAAYARDEQFDKAIEAQQRVIELLETNTTYTDDFKEFLRKDHQEKIRLYRNHQAYMDEKEDE